MSTKDDDNNKKKPVEEPQEEKVGISSLAKAKLLNAIDAIGNRLTNRIHAYHTYDNKIAYDIRDMMLDLEVMSVLEEIKKGNLN